jgi:ketosteroid isomerase-like protein
MKRFSITVAVLGLALGTPVLTLAQTGNAKAEQQVRELVNSLNQALIKADVPTLNKIFADEFTIIRPNGMAVGKADAVKDVESGKTKFESIEASDSNVHIYGNTAVMTTLENTSAQIGGHPISGQARNSYVCVKRGGRWIVVLRQITPVLPPRTEASTGK